MDAMNDLLATVYVGGDDAVAALHRYLELRGVILKDITKAFAEPRWIPVDKYLPEIGVSVLCSSNDPPGEDKVWVGQREQYEWYFPGANEMGTPTHWMPLPMPPEVNQ